MKWRFSIVFLGGMLVLAACDDALETQLTPSNSHLQNIRHSQLQTIDSLMWRQPDSALAVLLDYLDDDGKDTACHVSTNETYNKHYTQLLTSELLYKNYLPQQNRTELQQAAAYYDSLLQLTDTRKVSHWFNHKDTSRASVQTIAFLDARAHYINGVGYYENDSIVNACQEYLKALEVMKKSFDKNKLVGKRAKFMSYAYNRLAELYSDQFMSELSIECYRESLGYCQIASTTPNGKANILYHIGVEYNVLKQVDSAFCFYGKAMNYLLDTNSSLYRDILFHRALLSYQENNEIENALRDLKLVYNTSGSEEERQKRLLAMGWIHYTIGEMDSAICQLTYVYENPAKLTSQIQAAENLREIYQTLGDENKATEYVHFLSQFAVSNFENRVEQSCLSDMYHGFQQYVAKRQADREKARIFYKILLFSAICAGLPILIITLLAKRKHEKKLRIAEERLKSEEIRHTSEIEDLRVINNRLQTENHKLSIKEKPSSLKKAQAQEYDALIQESICLNLLHRFDRIDILTTNKPAVYSKLAIKPKEQRMLANVVIGHCPNFVLLLKECYPNIKLSDLEICRFFLIGLSAPQIAVLLQKDYSTIWRRSNRLKEMMGVVEPTMHLRQVLFESAHKG